MELSKNIYQQLYYIFSIFIFFIFLFMYYNKTRETKILNSTKLSLNDLFDETINPNCDNKDKAGIELFTLYKSVCEKKTLDDFNFFEYVMFIFLGAAVVCYEVDNKIINFVSEIVYNVAKTTEVQQSTESQKTVVQTNTNTYAVQNLTKSQNNSVGLSVGSVLTPTVNSLAQTVSNAKNIVSKGLPTQPANTTQPAKTKPITMKGGASPEKKSQIGITFRNFFKLFLIYIVLEYITIIVKERFMQVNEIFLKIFGNSFNKPSPKQKLSFLNEISTSLFALFSTIIIIILVINCMVYIYYLGRGLITSSTSRLSYGAIIFALPFVLASVGINLTVVEGNKNKGKGIGKAIKKVGKKIGKTIKKDPLGKTIKKDPLGKAIKKSNKAAAARAASRAAAANQAEAAAGSTIGDNAVNCTSYNYIWYFVAYFIIPICVSIYVIFKFIFIGLFGGATEIKTVLVGIGILAFLTLPIFVFASLVAVTEYYYTKNKDTIDKQSAQFRKDALNTTTSSTSASSTSFPSKSASSKSFNTTSFNTR